MIIVTSSVVWLSDVARVPACVVTGELQLCSDSSCLESRRSTAVEIG